jgi:short-subunit dehydrogenase
MEEIKSVYKYLCRERDQLRKLSRRREDNIKVDVKVNCVGCGVDSADSGQESATGSSEHVHVNLDVLLDASSLFCII